MLLTDTVVFLVNTVTTEKTIIRRKLCGDNDAVIVFELLEFV